MGPFRWLGYTQCKLSEHIFIFAAPVISIFYLPPDISSKIDDIQVKRLCLQRKKKHSLFLLYSFNIFESIKSSKIHRYQHYYHCYKVTSMSFKQFHLYCTVFL